MLSSTHRQASKATYLDNISFFNNLDKYQKLNLNFDTITFKKGQTIITEGQKGDEFFVIERG
jgi:hypothetical protein